MNQKFVDFVKKASKSDLIKYMVEHKLRELIFVARKNVISEVTLRKLLADKNIVAGELNSEVKKILGPLPKIKKKIKNHRKAIKKVKIVSKKNELEEINLDKKYRIVELKRPKKVKVKPIETAWDAIRWGTKVEIDKFLFESNCLTLTDISKLVGQPREKISNCLYSRNFPLPTKKVGVSGVPYFELSNKLFSASSSELISIFIRYGCYTLTQVKKFVVLPERVFEFFYADNLRNIKSALQSARKLKIQENYNFYLKRFCLADEAETIKLLIKYRKSSLRSLSHLTRCTEGKLKSIFLLKNIDVKLLFAKATQHITEIDYPPKLRLLEEGEPRKVFDLIEDSQCSDVKSLAKYCNCSQADITKVVEKRSSLLKPILRRSFIFYPKNRNVEKLIGITHNSEFEIAKLLQKNQLTTVKDVCVFANISAINLRKIESYKGINFNKILDSIIVYKGNSHLITLHNKSPEEIVPMMVNNDVNTVNKLAGLCEISKNQLLTLVEFLQLNIFEMLSKAKRILLTQPENIYLKTLKL